MLVGRPQHRFAKERGMGARHSSPVWRATVGGGPRKILCTNRGGEPPLLPEGKSKGRVPCFQVGLLALPLRKGERGGKFRRGRSFGRSFLVLVGLVGVSVVSPSKVHRVPFNIASGVPERCAYRSRRRVPQGTDPPPLEFQAIRLLRRTVCPRSNCRQGRSFSTLP